MSNPVIEAMKTRRSCRKFKADPVRVDAAEPLPAGAPRKPGRIVWA